MHSVDFDFEEQAGKNDQSNNIFYALMCDVTNLEVYAKETKHPTTNFLQQLTAAVCKIPSQVELVLSLR